MHSVLLGNGLNRLSLTVDWVELLERLASSLNVPHLTGGMEQKPLSLFFEELCAHHSGSASRRSESVVKKKIASIVGTVGVTELHRRYVDLFNVILTTNYDDALEQAISGPLYERKPLIAESRYSLFRRVRAGGKEVWHIHGEGASPESIVLGYDHYAGYLQKIRNYMTHGLPSRHKGLIVRSPVKAGVVDLEAWRWHRSWTDHFLRDHLHIVGLGFDFTEIDLWWLLLHKCRRKNVTGHTFFYDVILESQMASLPRPELSVLRSLGVKVQVIHAPSYKEGYLQVLEKIVANKELYPALLEAPQSRRSDMANVGYDVSTEVVHPDPQLELPMRKKRKRR